MLGCEGKGSLGVRDPLKWGLAEEASNDAV